MSDRRNLWCIRKNYRTDVKNNYYDHGSTCNCKDHGIQRNDTVYCRFYRSSNRKFLSTCCTTDRIYWNICYRKFYIKQCSKLQASTGAELNINQIWLVAANTVGSTAGKIISPQSIAVATAATATVGKESEILTKVIKYFVLFAVIYGLVCYFGLRLI